MAASDRTIHNLVRQETWSLRLGRLCGWTAICLGVGSLSSIFGPDSWYWSLNFPPLTPPAKVFGLVWGMLYLLMAIAIWWFREQADQEAKRLPTVLFWLQLGLNFLWCWLFFRLRRLDFAAFEITVLLLIVFGVLVLFWKQSRLASFLFLPYALWLCFATYLSFGFLLLN